MADAPNSTYESQVAPIRSLGGCEPVFGPRGGSNGCRHRKPVDHLGLCVRPAAECLKARVPEEATHEE